MDYRKGSIKRVFAAKVEHGEDLLEELTGLARREEIRSAFFTIIGAMGEAKQCQISNAKFQKF